MVLESCLSSDPCSSSLGGATLREVVCISLSLPGIGRVTRGTLPVGHPISNLNHLFIARQLLMRTCLRRSLATGLVFRRQLPLAPRCYAFLPGCGQGLALATTARPAPLRSALLLRRKLRRYLVSLRNCWPRQQPTPGSDAAQRVSPDFSPEVPVPSRRLRTGFRPFTCSLPAGYPTAPRPARPRSKTCRGRGP